MRTSYFKRFRMEIDLQRTDLPEPDLPEGFAWRAWSPSLLSRHAAVKFASFRNEIDSQVFPCLGDPTGCLRLMTDISHKETFLPQSTWLIVHVGSSLEGEQFSAGEEDCGTIQGIIQPGPIGAIQNVGVSPSFRGLGLGRALVLKSLLGFRRARLLRAYLEVTADNLPAVQLYRAIGFRLTKTTFKPVEAPTVLNF